MNAGCETFQLIYPFFYRLTRTHGLVVKVSWLPGFNSLWVLKLSAAPRPFCVALSQSVHWHMLFLCCCPECALYNFFFLGFCQWRSRADRVVNLNTIIQLPLFWRTWIRAQASTRPHVQAWQMSRDYSCCRASELNDGFVYSWFLENRGKPRPCKRHFQGSCAGLIIAAVIKEINLW